MFHRLRPVRKALIIMYYVDWCRGLVSLVHAFFLVQNLSLHHLDFNNNNKKNPASSWYQPRYWHRFFFSSFLAESNITSTQATADRLMKMASLPSVCCALARAPPAHRPARCFCCEHEA